MMRPRPSPISPSSPQTGFGRGGAALRAALWAALLWAAARVDDPARGGRAAKARISSDTNGLFDNRIPTMKREATSGGAGCKSLAEAGGFVHAA